MDKSKKTLAFELYTNIHLPKNLQNYVHVPNSERTKYDPYIHEFLHIFLSKAVIYIISDLTLLKIMWLFWMTINDTFSWTF